MTEIQILICGLLAIIVGLSVAVVVLKKRENKGP